MKQAMVLSGMSHVMVKLFAPWVSWKVLPYSGRIALQFVLHTVAFDNHPHHGLLALFLFK